MTRRGLLFTWLSLLLCSGGLLSQTRYFPPKTFGDNPQEDRFVSRWYSQQLKALGEPSLFELSKNPGIETYRFLWL